jgi:hypothetical protein
MSRRSKGPRLLLRKPRRPGERRRWVILDRDTNGRRIEVSTGVFDRKDRATAEKAFADYLGVGRHAEARRKFLAFIKQGIEPACYLYRHYHPSGDLLYVGISLNVQERHRAHFRGASWRDAIHQIVIEPFATREEALLAEEQAIRTEFPKFNRALNRRRHPIQEISKTRGVPIYPDEWNEARLEANRQKQHKREEIAILGTPRTTDLMRPSVAGLQLQ